MTSGIRMRATVTADDPQEVFRRELIAVLLAVGLAAQWVADADDELLWWLMREVK